MAKKIVLFLLTVCIFVGVFSLTGEGSIVANADTGPKPSVQVSFSGIVDDEYYITLLSKYSSVGPHSAKESYYEDSENTPFVWQKFNDYVDSDGFYFLGFYSKNNEHGTFEWNYYPPETFKVLIYFPTSDSFMVSSICDTYAFDSYFNVAVTYNGEKVDVDKGEVPPSNATIELNVKKDYKWGKELLGFFIRLILTLGIELLIALLFKLRDKQTFIFIAIVNIITQVLLNVILNIIDYKSGSWALVINYVWLELVVIIIEAIAYKKQLPKYRLDNSLKTWIPLVYAIVANTESFGIGVAISLILPSIF